MPDATHDTLREQLMYALTQGYMESGANADDDEAREAQTDAVLVVFAERERAIRAEYAPDESPGDVIEAWPDGTIILDDGITTWNPSRANAFLLAQRDRHLRDRMEALPEGLRKGDVRLADVLAVFSPPDPYDEPMIGGPHEVTNQYHSEPSRDPRQR